MGHCKEPLQEDMVQKTMPEHLSAEQIARYRKRTIAPGELLQVDDHFSQCAECRERLAASEELGAALQGRDNRPMVEQQRSLKSALFEAVAKGTDRGDLRAWSDSEARESKHLTYKQLEACVDGKMSRKDRIAIQTHLEACATCSEDLRDLNSFKTEWAGAPGQQKDGWWASFTAFWLTPRRATLALAMSAAVLLVVVIGVRRLGPTPEVPSTGAGNSGVTVSSHGSSDTLKENAIPGIDQLSSPEQAAVAEAVVAERIKPPHALVGLQGPQQMLLGEQAAGPEFKVLQPVGEVVLEVRPRFRWQPLAGAGSYSVAIFDSKLNPVQSGPAIRATEWTAAVPLRRGQVYLWQVTAKLRNGESVISPVPPSPEARFRVLDQDKTEEFTRIRSLQEHGTDADGSTHLVNGILYAQAGLLELGESEFKQIPESDAHYKLAQNLLKSIRELRQPKH
jgi:hypothetical protein